MSFIVCALLLFNDSHHHLAALQIAFSHLPMATFATPNNPLVPKHDLGTDPDLASELLIAQLLEQEVQDLLSGKAAEQLQLQQITGHDEVKPLVSSSFEDDAELAFQLYAADARMSSDATFAASLQAQTNAGQVADHQYAQGVAARERKFALDVEFAKKLHQLEDQGSPTADAQDVEGVLDTRVIQDIMSQTYGDTRKGKRRAHEDETLNGKTAVKRELHSPEIKAEEGVHVVDLSLATCGICLDSFRLTYSPINAAKFANSSSMLPFGMEVPCPGKHKYCGGCLTSYIRTKLDPNDVGQATVEAIVFPIKCPECTVEAWPAGITESVAERVLSEKTMQLWHQQKTFDSLPRLFCPNSKCSQFVQAHEDPDQPQAQCPSCQHLMCVPCRVPWHADITCEQFQALPLDERSPEDRATLQLARSKRWRRCYQCQSLVELAQGCNHITCRCGAHFCFRCGAKWSMVKGQYKCTRVPACEVWDEDMLLDEQERVNGAEPLPPPPPIAVHNPPPAQPIFRAPPPALPPPPYQQQAPHRIGLAIAQRQPPQLPLEWMEDDDVIRGRHWFTNDMFSSLTCGYCGCRVNSRAALRHHLANVRHHSVFACCGRFFRREVDFARHVESYPNRYGYHAYQYSVVV